MAEAFRSTGEVARELGLSRDALQMAMREGAPAPASRVGGRRVFQRADIEAVARWLQERKQKRNQIRG